MRSIRYREHAAGSIVIDGIDISRVPLTTLRARLGIILQSSVMFSNTLRFNLDPFNEHTDTELWAVLHDVGLGPMMEALSATMKADGALATAPCVDAASEIPLDQKDKNTVVPSQHLGLDYLVEEGGSNFSEGQRQLITFCRALLKKSTVLVLDEATSSLDNLSDIRVQELLAERKKRSLQ